MTWDRARWLPWTYRATVDQPQRFVTEADRGSLVRSSRAGLTIRRRDRFDRPRLCRRAARNLLMATLNQFRSGAQTQTTRAEFGVR
jgi:hypothetical protein